MTLTITAITDDAGLEALGDEWQALHARAAAVTPFQSWEWMASWWRHLGRGRLWLLTARVGDTLVGLLPLRIERYRGLPLRRVSFLAQPASDYHDLVAAPEHTAACRDAFLRYILAHSHAWDLVDLPDLPSGSALVDDPALRRAGARLHYHRLCPVIALAPSWQEQRGRLGRNLRARLGRRRRQLERDFALGLDRVDADDLEPALEELFYLHNARWRRRGLAGAFARAAVRRFHLDVARRFLGRGWLRLHRLRLDGKTRALFYCFADGGRIYYYLSGFDEAFGRYSPGAVLMAHAVEDAIGERAHDFDLLRGDENYKREWRSLDRATYRLVLARPGSLRGRLALALNWLERRLDGLGTHLRNRLWGRHPQGTTTATAATPALAAAVTSRRPSPLPSPARAAGRGRASGDRSCTSSDDDSRSGDDVGAR